VKLQKTSSSMPRIIRSSNIHVVPAQQLYWRMIWWISDRLDVNGNTCFIRMVPQRLLAYWLAFMQQINDFALGPLAGGNPTLAE